MLTKMLLAVIVLNSPPIARADEVCEEVIDREVSSLIKTVDTIYPNVAGRGLHYLYKNYVHGHKSCRKDEVWVQGPSFSEAGLSSEGKEIKDAGLKAFKLKNAFCMPKVQFEFEQGLGKSVFQTRVSSGSKNQGTSFLVGDNIIMTNHHVAAPGKDGKDCKALEVTLNTEKENWVGCKKVLFCDKGHDVCFVEMKQPSPGVELGDLVPKTRLNCSQVKAQPGMMIGNSNAFGIQGSAGPITKEYNGVMKHHIPMVGGASGSPVMNSGGEVLGINFGHNGVAGKLKDFVSVNEDTDYNVATSMYWVRNKITKEMRQAQSSAASKFKGPSVEDLKKIDDALKLNPTCHQGLVSY